MPNQSHSGIRGIPWSRCQRCGFDYPTDKLVRQTGGKFAGLIVCREKCLDNTLVDQRQAIIQQVLENSPEEMQVADILRNPPEPDINST